MMRVAYLCDGHGCDRENKSCAGEPWVDRGETVCRRTTDPAHARHGACEHPEDHPERFAELRPGVYFEKSLGGASS